MQRLRIVIASAVLLSFSLPHCAMGGFLFPKAIAAAPTVEHHHTADDAEEYQSMHHSNHDCCDGCVTCQKETKYTPPNEKRSVGISSAAAWENEVPLAGRSTKQPPLFSHRTSLYVQARDLAHSLVKLE